MADDETFDLYGDDVAYHGDAGGPELYDDILDDAPPAANDPPPPEEPRGPPRDPRRSHTTDSAPSSSSGGYQQQQQQQSGGYSSGGAANYGGYPSQNTSTPPSMDVRSQVYPSDYGQQQSHQGGYSSRGGYNSGGGGGGAGRGGSFIGGSGPRSFGANEGDTAPLDKGVDNPLGPNGTRSWGLLLGEMDWWTTDQDLRQCAVRAGLGDRFNFRETTFFEHKVNGKSRGTAYIEFTDPQAVTQMKEWLDNNDLGGKRIKVKYTAPGAEPGPNPFRIVPKDPKEARAEAAAGGYAGSQSSGGGGPMRSGGPRGGMSDRGGGGQRYNPYGAPRPRPDYSQGVAAGGYGAGAGGYGGAGGAYGGSYGGAYGTGPQGAYQQGGYQPRPRGGAPGYQSRPPYGGGGAPYGGGGYGSGGGYRGR